jgi:hypothetical protein
LCTHTTTTTIPALVFVHVRPENEYAKSGGWWQRFGLEHLRLPVHDSVSNDQSQPSKACDKGPLISILGPVFDPSLDFPGLVPRYQNTELLQAACHTRSTSTSFFGPDLDRSGKSHRMVAGMK